jgi:hypothetical protein
MGKEGDGCGNKGGERRESRVEVRNSPSNWPAPRHLSDTAEYRYHVNVESSKYPFLCALSSLLIWRPQIRIIPFPKCRIILTQNQVLSFSSVTMASI